MSLQPDSSTRYFVGLEVHRDTIVACVYDAHRRWPCYQAEFSVHEAQAWRGFIAHLRVPFGEPCGRYEASSCGECYVS